MKLSEIVQTEILMIVSYGDRRRPHQGVLFNNVHPERSYCPIHSFQVSKK